MVPTTWTALLVLVAAVLPGATFTYGFERQAGAFGVTLADRVLRFVAVSVFFDLAYAWPAFLLHRAGVGPPPWDAGRTAAAWAAVVAGLGLPFAAGTIVGGLYATRTTRSGWSRLRRLLSAEREGRLLEWVLGGDPAPRAWDRYFAQRPRAYLRVRTHDGAWLGGSFASRSYAGPFPQEGDLLIEEAWPIDDAGTFGDHPLGYSLYIPAQSISFVEIVPRDDGEEAQ